MAKYLITGGAGFIGSHLAEKLLSSGQEVVVLDNLASGHKYNLEGFDNGMLTFIEDDIRDLSACRAAMRGVDYVLHQAARPSVQRSVEDPLLSHDVNVSGGLNVLKAAQEAGVKRVVMASSSSVYGNIEPVDAPKRENMEMRPLSPYAANKVCMEYYGKVFYQTYGLETVQLRYFNVFGARQDPNSVYAAVIPKFIFALLDDDRPVIYGDGRQSRDFTHVDNVVAANLAACSVPGIGGMSFNVAAGKSYTLLSLLEKLKKLLNRPDIEPQFAPARQGDVYYSLADLSLIQSRLGYEVKVDFDQGLFNITDLALKGRYILYAG